jgi:hypothetical protein
MSTSTVLEELSHQSKAIKPPKAKRLRWIDDPSEDLVVFFPNGIAKRWRLPFSEMLAGGLPLSCRYEQRTIRIPVITNTVAFSFVLCAISALGFWLLLPNIGMAIAGFIIALPFAVPAGFGFGWMNRPRPIWVALWLSGGEKGFTLQPYELGRMRDFWRKALAKEARKDDTDPDEIPTYTRMSLWNLTRMKAAKNWLFAAPRVKSYKSLSIGLAVGFFIAVIVLVLLMASEIAKT